MKLFTIGDSIAQGFMSGAAARTDLSFSTLIARALGLNPGPGRGKGINYYYPEWRKGGLPANLEDMMRRLNRQCGADIRGLEWLKVAGIINSVIDESEDYYERGQGREDEKYQGNVPFFHNISVWMLTVADAWLVKPDRCFDAIKGQDLLSKVDGYLAIANAPFYRTALKVLNPNLEKNYSQLDWLEYHAGHEGVENLILWLGINNTIGTILSFEIEETPNEPGKRPHEMTFAERCSKGWNLWHPEDFAAEYKELINRVDRIMVNRNINKDWRVFIGSVPHLTIVPFMKGVGPKQQIGAGGIYYKYYTYMLFGEKYARQTGNSISMQQVLQIDNRVNEYNKTIRKLINHKNSRHEKRNKRRPYHLVDICDTFNCLAWKRNNGVPTYKFPSYFSTLKTPVDTKYYHADAAGKVEQGGIFGLDGVHPSAIGQGLIAHEFIKVMRDAGVTFKGSLDWQEIFASDTLYREPLTLMADLYRHEKLARFFTKRVLKLARKIRRGI